MEYIPSLLAAHPLKLQEGLDYIIKSGLKQVHLDCMDGHFVPNIAFGPAVVNAVRKYAPQLFRDVHLMLSHPEDFIEKYVVSGAQRIFIHLELEKKSLESSIEILKKSKVLWGIAINPETPITYLESYLDYGFEIDRLLVMSVQPGFSGQKFLSKTYERVQAIKKRFPMLKLCVDGGITPVIANNLREMGVCGCIEGSSFFW